MKLTTPEDMATTPKTVSFEYALASFDKGLGNSRRDENHYCVWVEGELSKEDSDKIVLAFTNAGWKDVSVLVSDLPSNKRKGGLSILTVHKPK
jgi:hypothetical protein